MPRETKVGSGERKCNGALGHSPTRGEVAPAWEERPGQRASMHVRRPKAGTRSACGRTAKTRMAALDWPIPGEGLEKESEAAEGSR